MVERRIFEQHAGGAGEPRLGQAPPLEVGLGHDELHEPADAERDRAEDCEDGDQKSNGHG